MVLREKKENIELSSVSCYEYCFGASVSSVYDEVKISSVCVFTTLFSLKMVYVDMFSIKT